jgi:hypothetical protein
MKKEIINSLTKNFEDYVQVFEKGKKAEMNF